MNAWVPVVASILAVIIAAAFPAYATLKGLRENKPVVESTADKNQADANAANFESQQGIIRSLNDELTRQEKRSKVQDARLEALEERLNATTARVEERDEQNDLLAAQLRTAQENLKLCRTSGQLMSDWMRDHYATEHPGSEQPKVQFFHMLNDDEDWRPTNRA